MRAMTPGSIHKETARPKAIRVLRSPLEIGPSLLRSSFTYSSAPEMRRTSGLFTRIRITQRNPNMSRQIGNAATTQEKKVMRMPVSCSMNAIPIRFGGVPMGVRRPPTPAP